MVTRAEVVELASANANVSALVRRDLHRFWSLLDTSDPVRARDALLDFLPQLVQTYGEVSATVAADWYDEVRASSGVVLGRFTAIPADPVSPDVVVQRARFGAIHLFRQEPDRLLAFLDGAIDEYALQPGRDSIAQSVARDPARPRWARVPTGTTTCGFCRMLASRGAVYVSEAAAAGMSTYHAHCDCVATPIWRGTDYPEGYDPDRLYEEFQDVRSAATGDSDSAIVAEYRRRDTTS